MNKMLLISEDIALQLSNHHGKVLISKGDFIREPSLSVPLNLPHQTHLAWKDGHWYLVSDMDMIEKDGQHFRIHIEYLLPHFTLNVSETYNLQEDLGEVKICSLSEKDKNTALCFPSVKKPHPFTYPLVMKDDKTPIGYALSGERGVINTTDQDGQTIIAAYTPVGTLGLGMVKKVLTYELYQPLRDQLHLVLPALLTLLGFSIMFLYSQIVPIVSRTVQSQREAVLAKTLLQDSQTRLQAIFDTVEEGIVIMNDVYITQSANPKAMTIFGYVNSEIMGKDICDLIP
ncbi:MAG TPA: PAS domain S-box protein, partial [Candidatus Nitrosotenuis sp.]|nr:PAS domain S-box protein [Candidatus Nitrosotenuis sp.]